ncbi:MAG: hypothetical protein B9S32_00445 [Verrucomicrobia bacterium Tous-C9LFEB]|nr:MAG: hypothetical protein B9S32_00445 [Verrucomicrobia bacterium Tous-C9LFEB]
MFKPPGDCPVCGEFVPKQAKACPGCGADAKSGWQEDDAHDGLDLPDAEFDYNAFVAEEFGGNPTRKTNLHPVWWITAVVLIVLGMIAFLLGR